MFQINAPDTNPISSETKSLITIPSDFKIIESSDYNSACDRLRLIASMEKRVASIFKDSKTKANQAHKALCDLENEFLRPLKKTKEILAKEINEYLINLRKKKEEEAAIRRYLAEEEQRAQIEALKKQKEDERLNLAEQLQQDGNTEAADHILNQEVNVQSPLIIPKPVSEIPKTEGVHTRTTYKAEVFDLMLLVKAVAEGRAPLACILANEKVLNQQATALKQELRIDGVRVLEQMTVVARA